MTGFDKIPTFSHVVIFATENLLCKIYPLDSRPRRTTAAELWKNRGEEFRERNPKKVKKGVDFV